MKMNSFVPNQSHKYLCAHRLQIESFVSQVSIMTVGSILIPLHIYSCVIIFTQGVGQGSYMIVWLFVWSYSRFSERFTWFGVLLSESPRSLSSACPPHGAHRCDGKYLTLTLNRKYIQLVIGKPSKFIPHLVCLERFSQFGGRRGTCH